MKAVSVEEAVAMIPNGATVMVGGFMGVGTPERLLDELVRQRKSELSIISNDAAVPGKGVGKLFDASLVSTLTASHIGLNPNVQKQMMANKVAVSLVPQGTLVERIRAGGCGLGGVLTPTGVGTMVEEGKRRIDVDGKSFLVETALRADFALIHAFLADYLGNLSYALTARNFNPVMAMAAETVIVTAENIVPVGVIAPDQRRDPCTARRLSRHQRVNHGCSIAHCAARGTRTSKPGNLVNLGIGIPTLVANYVPSDLKVFFQSENGLIGTGPIPEQGMAHPLLTDAGGRPISALPGACVFDSAMSFGLIRGGHVDVTVLGGLQVDADGHLANWMIPGKMVPGMGGAMDLVSGAKRVIVAMQHAAKGKSKIVQKCALPLTSSRPVDLVVTDMAVIVFSGGRIMLQETAPGVSVAEVMAVTEADLFVPANVPEMKI